MAELGSLWGLEIPVISPIALSSSSTFIDRVTALCLALGQIVVSKICKLKN